MKRGSRPRELAAGVDDIRLFEMTHAGHAIRREEHPFREDARFNDTPELAEHWRPGVVCIWLRCARCNAFLVGGVEGS